MGSSFDNLSTAPGMKPDGFQPWSAHRKAESLRSLSVLTRREAPF
jgi:hypothetical protein